jgi:hypothetical protein
MRGSDKLHLARKALGNLKGKSGQLGSTILTLLEGMETLSPVKFCNQLLRIDRVLNEDWEVRFVIISRLFYSANVNAFMCASHGSTILTP